MIRKPGEFTVKAVMASTGDCAFFMAFEKEKIACRMNREFVVEIDTEPGAGFPVIRTGACSNHIKTIISDLTAMGYAQVAEFTQGGKRR